MEANPDQTRLERMDQYLDGVLSGSELAQFEQSLQQDAALASELETLKMTRSLVKNYGLREELKSLHSQAMTERQAKKGPRIIRLINYSRQIAAGIAILLLCSFAYRFALLSNDNLYAQQAEVYQTSTVRGEDASSGIATQLNDTYAKGEYRTYVDLYENNQIASIKETFLAGNAYLALEKPAQAVNAFRKVLTLNQAAAKKQFYEDAEYYLALSLLKNGEVESADQLFTKIKDDAAHPYNNRVKGLFYWQLRLLRLKVS